MPREFRPSPSRTAFNKVLGFFLRLGFGPGQTRLLTTVGRRSGRRVAQPVSVLELDGSRWLVSPYGQRGWVWNVRASGEAELRRGRTNERVTLQEADPETAAPVLHEYYEREPITRPYFEAGEDSPVEAFEAEAAQHPVFRITSSTEV